MLPNTNQDILTILYTNDLHSHFGAMVRIASMVNELRAEQHEAVLLLDIGDHMDRAAPETEGTMGQANVDVLNLTAYDAITIGNNEGLTFTPEQLDQAYTGLVCQVVCANMLDMETGKPPAWMKKHTILNKAGFKIGIIGATAAYAEFYKLLGLTALDPLKSIETSVSDLRSKVDLIVVMSHVGLPFDRELAEQVPGIDLILGGHTHHLLEEPLWIGQTAIVAAGKFGRHLGQITVERDMITGKAKVVSGICLPVESGPEDVNVAEALNIHRLRAGERMARTVAVIEEELPVRYDVESPFGNLLAQAVRRFTGSDLSIVNSGQLLAGLPAGEISEGMLHERCPSPINPCRMNLLGKHILYSLEQSLLADITDKAIFGFGFRGKQLGGICVDGMEIIYDPTALPFHKIIQASNQGVPIVPDGIYSVGTLDMFTFGIGYECLKQGSEQEFLLPEFLRDLLRMELQTAGAIESCFYHRWKSQTENYCE
ncbi:bifunctional metallophosphatase/5'-nucleotidase [Paenibacillus bouchesdurhonensis]|uniref:bifunctional metallophosphatase/5'-nucleotidase n=1 Tax=Paenibacillus bouchesdurhonensis TaxID=1870990 RepID=UPI000DA62051|nr:bifunctional UDP-sugar hydrolase/5'-nucleotidase [Paenibacillus bouchesdurhonensis]